MARKILILGTSGSGKSHSIQYLDPKSTFILSPDRKDLPWRGSTKNYITVRNDQGKPLASKSNLIETNSMAEIHAYIKVIAEKRPDIKTIVIDTITYAMIASVMREINTENYKKFTQFAEELYKIVDEIPNLRKDLDVFFMAHVEEENVDGVRYTSFKVPAGKLTREKIVPEGLFTVVLYCEAVIEDGNPKHFFVTNNRGHDTAKSPEGMFPGMNIENNLQYVKECLDTYYKGEAPPEPRKVEAA